MLREIAPQSIYIGLFPVELQPFKDDLSCKVYRIFCKPQTFQLIECMKYI